MVIKKNILLSEVGNYKIIGVSCHLPDYQLVHFINKSKIFDFKRCKELTYIINEVEEVKYPLYFFDDSLNYKVYYIISNRCENGILINELRAFDYFFIYEESFENERLINVIQFLKGIQGVLAATKVKIKNNLNFIISDIELQILNYKKNNIKNAN